MKIRHVPARKFGRIDSKALKISPFLQLLFGNVDADTSAIRNSIRYLYFGKESDFVLGESDKAELDLQFEGMSSISSRFSDGLRMREPATRHEFNRVLREIDYATYCSFFDLNFGEGETSGTQICFQLKQRFNVPYGDILNGTNFELGQQSAEDLKESINLVNQQIKSCQADMKRFEDELHLLEDSVSDTGEFGIAQRRSLENRIENLQEKLELMKIRACELEDEIELARQEAVPSKKIDEKDAFSQSNLQLADQLASIDAQVQRWKNVKNDIDGRLTELKGDLCSSRVADFDAAFDELRVSIGFVEEKLLELLDAEDNSNENSETLHNLVAVQHQVCDLLSNAQESWRDVIVKSEIADLDRCSVELNRYLDRLGNERNKLEFGSTASSKHCQCTTHRVAKVDLEYVENLQVQHSQLLEELASTQNRLDLSHEELLSIQGSEEVEAQKDQLRRQLKSCQREHSDLQDKKEVLLNRLRVSLATGEQNSRLIQLVSSHLRALTNEKVSRVFLQDGGRDIELVKPNGLSVAFRNTDFETRNKTRMAISLGCAQLLAESGYSVPLVWEDPFIGMEAESIDLVIRSLQRFSKSFGQVVLLSNNRLIPSIFDQKKLPSLDIPDRYSGDDSPGVPFETDRRRNISVTTDWANINKHFDLAAMDQHGTELYWFENEVGQLSVHGNSLPANARPNDSNRNLSRPARSIGSKASSNARSRVRSSDNSSKGEDSGYRFYLNLSSDVEAAPTIGPKTAERLARIGVYTVSDLIEEEPDSIATQLDHRRIKPRDVWEWQRQAMLVCQVPNLRGHDAQLLVACGVDTADKLALMDSEALFEIIGPFSQSKEGQKLLRGSKDPDQNEVSDWVRWARHQRTIERAA